MSLTTAHELLKAASLDVVPEGFTDEDPDIATRVRLGRDDTNPGTVAWAAYFDAAGDRLGYRSRAESARKSGMGLALGLPHMSWRQLDKAAAILAKLDADRYDVPVLDVELPELDYETECWCGDDQPAWAAARCPTHHPDAS